MAEPQVPRLELPFFAADRTNLFNRLELIQPRRVAQLAFFRSDPPDNLRLARGRRLDKADSTWTYSWQLV